VPARRPSRARVAGVAPSAQAGSATGAAAVRGGLTRERVLAAALEIVDADGVDGLTMRRLGTALSREAMALYRYAPTKAALLDGVTELVFSQFVVDPAAADWETELHRAAGAFRALALRHPNVAPLLITRPLITPLGLRPPGVLRPMEDY
jgi:AcrR family transcriptional regulator